MSDIPYLPDEVTEEQPVEASHLWVDFQEAIDEAEHPAAAVETAEHFVNLLAMYVHRQDGSEAMVDSLVSRCATEVGVKKSVLTDQYESKLAELKNENDDRYRLDDLILEKLDRLVVSRSTDHNTETTYQWYFHDPDVVLETNGEHRDATQFRNMYLDASGNVAKAPSDAAKPWYQWINNHIDEQLTDDDGIAEVQKTTGERTLAVNDVRQLLQSLDATTDLQAAVTSNYLYLEDEDSDTVLIENSIIERALSDHDSVNFRALNAEMDAKGLLKGPAKQTSTPTISNITMWRIDRDWVEPINVVDSSDISLVMRDE